MSLYSCPSCGATYDHNAMDSCVVCGEDFTRKSMLIVDTDEHSPYYERPSKHDSEVIAAWCVIGMLVIVAGAALWKSFA